MDARSLHQMALKTSRSLSEAWQFNRNVLEALQTIAGGSRAPTEATGIAEATANCSPLKHPPAHQSSSNLPLEVPPRASFESWHQQLSDFASMSSSAQNLSGATDSDWLHTRQQVLNLSNSSNSKQPEPQKKAVGQQAERLAGRRCLSWESGDTGASARQQGVQEEVQSTAWQKAQNRLLSAIDIGSKKGGGRKVGGGGSGSQRKPRRSQSVTADVEHQRDREVKKVKKQQQQQQQQQHRQSNSAATSGASGGQKKSGATSSDALTSSLTSSLHLKPAGRKSKSRLKASDKSAGAAAAAAAAAGATTTALAASTVADVTTALNQDEAGPLSDLSASVSSKVRQHEAACLRAVDRLLQACRQALDHPSLASALADTVGRLARELQRRLEPYSSEADRPFPISCEQLDQIRSAVQTAAEAKISGLSHANLECLAEALSQLRVRLHLHLKPEAVLPMMEPGHRLRVFCEYCYLLLEDCSRLTTASGVSASTAGSHASVLLSIMRYFVGNQHLLWPPSSDSGRAVLLMRSYEQLEKLGEANPSGIEQRLRQQSNELGADLAALFKLLMREAKQRGSGSADIEGSGQQHVHQQQQQQQDAMSPRSCDKSSQQQQQQQQHQSCTDLTAICTLADRIIRHLKRLVESPTGNNGSGEATASEPGRLCKSIARLTAACEQCGLRCRPAYLDKLRELQRACESTSSTAGGDQQLRGLNFEFFLSVLTDTLLFRRSLGRRLASLGAASGCASEAGSSSCAKQVPCASPSPSAVSARREIASLLGLISSVVCDLYLSLTGGATAGDAVISSRTFQADLQRLIDLANRRGLAFLESAKKRQLRQCLLKLMGHMKTSAGTAGCDAANGSSGSVKMPPKSIETLITLLLEIRLHLDRNNLTSSSDLFMVEKTVQFSLLARYLALKGSRVVAFTGWTQDTPQLRKMLCPTSKDPAVLRLERHCHCIVSVLSGEEGKQRSGRQRSRALLAVDTQASHGGHTACIRLLSDALKAKGLTLEPCEATVQVHVQL